MHNIPKNVIIECKTVNMKHFESTEQGKCEEVIESSLTGCALFYKGMGKTTHSYDHHAMKA